LKQAGLFRAMFVVGVAMLAFSLRGSAAEGEDINISSNTSWAAGEYTYRDITVTNNAVLTLQGNTGDGTGVTINARNITVESGSSISADAQGYPSDGGPGAGTTYTTYGGGAGHSGPGGDAHYVSGALGRGGIGYDDNFNPQMLGSGGGGGGTSQGGSGGGAIILNISGDLVANGNITASGGNSAHIRRGGGSGGTIKITADSVSGSANVTASGGLTGGDGGGGAGGRISIFYQTEMVIDPANITAAAGDGYYDGAEGTIFLYKSDTNDGTIRSNMTLSPDAGIDQDGNSTTDGNYYFNDLTITNDSTVVFDGAYTDDSDGRGVLVDLSGTFDLDGGSSIDAAGEGYGPLSGPGKGATDGVIGSGAGYGGDALDVGVAAGGKKYGSAINPDDLGSGGGGPASTGGAGGGIVKIVADGNANISGTINASGDTGQVSSGNRGGGGSGGTVFVKSNSFTDDEATGVIDASGGDGDSGGYGGGGAGGRIALFYSAMTFNSDNISVDGGQEIGGLYAEDGTIFLYNTTSGDVAVSQDMTLYATEGIGRDGTIRGDGVYYFNNLTVSNNATLTIGGTYSNDTDGHGVYMLLDGDMSVEAGSTLSANGQGYASETGEGPGQGSGDIRSGSGGSYGGLGGAGYSVIGGSDPTQTYSSEYLKAPFKLGSGGGGCWIDDGGGSGGGAIVIRVLGNLAINGSITADGDDGVVGTADYGAGGGSGGSVYITADNISGSGTISSAGGAGGSGAVGGGGGGGGRISVIYYTAMTLDEGNVTASGGTGSTTPARDGATGTVNIEQRALPVDDFDMVNPNNGSTLYTNTTEVDIDPSDTDVEAYYEVGESTLVPLFNDSNWEDVSAGKTLSAGEGEKTLSAWLKDEDELISASYGQASITLDQTAPVLTIDQPGGTVTDPAYTISGDTSDALSGIDTLIMTGGTEIPVNPDNSYSVNTTLSEGVNNITLTSSDKAGNEKADTLTVTYQVSPSPTPTPTPTPTATSTSTATPAPTATATSDDDPGDGDGGSGGDEIAEGDDGYYDSTTSSGSGPLDFSKIEEEWGDEFYTDGDELVFYIDNPTIYGRSEPGAKIILRLNFDQFETTADADGNWQYTFNHLAKGTYDLFISEYKADGTLIKSSSYTMKIADKPLDESTGKNGFSRWWLLLLLVIPAGFYLYKKRAG